MRTRNLLDACQRLLIPLLYGASSKYASKEVFGGGEFINATRLANQDDITDLNHRHPIVITESYGTEVK